MSIQSPNSVLSAPVGLTDLEADERLAVCSAALAAGIEGEWLESQLRNLLTPDEPGLLRTAFDRIDRRVRTARLRPLLDRLERLFGPGPEEIAGSAARCAALHFGSFPRLLRAQLRQIAGERFDAALATLAVSERASDRRTVLEIAGGGELAAAAPMLADLLADAEPDIAREAERLLAHAARDIDPDDVPQRRMISEVVVRAARAFPTHRMHGAFLAVLLLGDRPGDRTPIGALLDEREGPVAQGIRGVLRYTKMPIGRQRAFEWLPVDHLARAAEDRLLRTEGPGDHEAVLSRSALCLVPARAQRLARLRVSPRIERQTIGVMPEDTPRRVEHLAVPTQGPLPDTETFAALSPASRRGLPRFVASLDLTRPLARAALEPMLTDSDPSVRLAAVSAADRADLPDYLFETDPAVARSAFLRWADARLESRVPAAPGAVERSRLCERLRRSPVDRVRSLAKAESNRIEVLASPVAALALQADDPRALRRHIAEAFDSRDRAGRLAGIAVLRRLRITESMADRLAALVDDQDHVVAATAVAALGDCRDAEAVGALTSALAAAEPRVRANAVEAAGHAIAHVGADPGIDAAGIEGRLTELKLDPHHRVRANATVIDLRRGQQLIEGTGPLFAASAVTALVAMLSDERAEHRLAGAWLAERVLLGPGRAALGLAWPDLAVRIERLAFDDTDERVRARARGCLDRLRIAQRDAWARQLSAEPAKGAA